MSAKFVVSVIASLVIASPMFFIGRGNPSGLSGLPRRIKSMRLAMTAAREATRNDGMTKQDNSRLSGNDLIYREDSEYIRI